MDYRILAMLMLGVVLVSGCVQQAEPPPTRTNINEATIACVAECNRALADNRDLTNGPCLSNKIVENWVCDVAHSPRKQVDNDPVNQCSAYGDTASHFIEVDPNCNFIRAS